MIFNAHQQRICDRMIYYFTKQEIFHRLLDANIQYGTLGVPELNVYAWSHIQCPNTFIGAYFSQVVLNRIY